MVHRADVDELLCDTDDCLVGPVTGVSFKSLCTRHCHMRTQASQEIDGMTATLACLLSFVEMEDCP
eukprot:601397-Amphidinium_carterae.1